MSEVISSASAQLQPGLEFELNQPAKRRKISLGTRITTLIPYIIVYTFWLLAAFVATIVAWFTILITGRYPRGLFNFTAGAWRHMVRVNAYAILIVDSPPPFSGRRDPAYPLQVDVTPLPQYNRLLTLFRFPLLIPFFIVTYAAEILAFIAWVPSLLSITFLRYQPSALQRICANFIRLWARFTSSAFLMTEILWVS
jgi:Domain of unknown function (DUF4389)